MNKHKIPPASKIYPVKSKTLLKSNTFQNPLIKSFNIFFTEIALMFVTVCPLSHGIRSVTQLCWTTAVFLAVFD